MATRCISCREEKESEGFYSHPQMKNGHVNVCKECHKGRMRSRSRTNVKVQEYDKRRAKTPERIAKGKQITDAWRLNNPVAYSAHTAVSNAVRDGRLKKLPCEFCGEIKVHAHHKNYLEPLNVVWLCAKCHHRLHAMFPELEGKNKQIDRKENVDGTAHCRNRI